MIENLFKRREPGTVRQYLTSMDAMGIGDPQLHSAEGSCIHRSQEGQPQGAVLANAHVHAQKSPLTQVVDSDGHRPVTTPGVAGITRWAAIRVRQKVGRHTPPP